MICFVGFIWFALGKAVYEMPSKIKNNETYMKYFDEKKYLQLQNKKNEHKANLLKLRKEQCGILIQAQKDIVPIKIEIYILKGYTREEAVRMATRKIKKNVKKCQEHGFLPYYESD